MSPRASFVPLVVTTMLACGNVDKISADASVDRPDASQAIADAAAASCEEVISFRSNGDIWSIRPDGTELTQLTDAPVSQGAVWSSDGRKIAFLSNRDGSTRVYVANPDGSDPQVINAASEDPSNLVWVPGSDRLSYIGGPEEFAGQIITIDSDGENRVNVVSNAARGTGYSWNAEGTELVYAVGGGIIDLPVVRLNADGSNPIEISAVRWASMVWSSNSSELAFVSSVQLNRSSSDGSNVTALTTTPDTIATSPRWGANGSILFSFGGLGANPDPRQISRVSGVAITNLSNTTNDDYLPRLSPDGTTIAFLRSTGVRLELATMAIDGSAQTVLTTPDGAAEQRWRSCP